MIPLLVAFALAMLAGIEMLHLALDVAGGTATVIFVATIAGAGLSGRLLRDRGV